MSWRRRHSQCAPAVGPRADCCSQTAQRTSAATPHSKRHPAHALAPAPPTGTHTHTPVHQAAQYAGGARGHVPTQPQAVGAAGLGQGMVIADVLHAQGDEAGDAVAAAVVVQLGPGDECVWGGGGEVGGWGVGVGALLWPSDQMKAEAWGKRQERCTPQPTGSPAGSGSAAPRSR